MKKFFYIFAVALTAFMACNKEIDSPSNELDNAVEMTDGPMATLTFTATFPDTNVPTRAAWGDTPEIDNLYVAVFGQSSNVNGGTLVHWAPATYVEQKDNTHTYTAKYTVTLPLSTEGREVHFIANYPSDTPPTFDREKQIIPQLYTENGNGAYWQRVSLPDGIIGVPQTDGTYVLDDDTKALLSDVHLVRNFAKITVQPALATTEFVIDGYTLINVPTKGTIAPMNEGSFSTLYTQIASYCDPAEDFHNNFFDGLLNANYLGFMPEGTQIDTSDPGVSSLKEPSDNFGFYMYERPTPTETNTQTAVICKITWKSQEWFEEQGKEQSPNYQYAGNTYYYKVELVGGNGNEGGEYIPICRNIWYKMNLNALDGDGEQTYKDAFDGPYFGNVSASIETATLNEITDNISTLVVNRMDYTAIDNGKTVDIYFKYIPEKNGSPTTNDVTLSVRTVGTYSQAIAPNGVSNVSAVTSGEFNGGGHVTVSLNDVPETGMLRGVLRVQGNKSGKRVIFRDIVFTVMSPVDFLSTAEDVSTSGDNVTVQVILPPNLSYSVFPVHVKIEAQNKNLTSSSTDLPVGFGKSAFDDDKNSFYFIKTIQYSDYYYKDASGKWVYNTEGYTCNLKKTSNEAVNIKLSADYFNTKDLY